MTPLHQRAIAAFFVTGIAWAPSLASAEDTVPKDLARLVSDDGRPRVQPAEPDVIRFQVHGEYQLRATGERSFPLDVSATTAIASPRAFADSLGQNVYANHWLRITPRLQIKDKVEIVGQIDLVTGLALGELAHDSSADRTPRNDYDGFSNVQPRWLYVDWLTKYGLWRVGQQPTHWGLGLVANDGDHPTLFGDYRYGSISEAVLFGTKPMGKDGPLTVAASGQLVYRDATADLTRGDHAFQGVLAGYWERGPNQIGVYGAYRHQTTDRTTASDVFAFTDVINAGVIDVAGHFASPVIGPHGRAYVFGAAEVATIFGNTNAVRTVEQAQSGDRTTIRSWGGAAQLGVVHTATDGEMDWGDWVGQIEIGYASGDADPYDGTEHRFTFDPNHKVGLLLFDEVMRFQTARAASAAQDANLASSAHPTPGVDLLPSNGGVFGAQYVNPTAIVRPRPWIDLKAGMVLAQTTADVVDPYRLVIQGQYVNYRGGDARRHDLGVEVDLGTEARAKLDYGMMLTLGAQGGVLFPGGALADASAAGMRTPWIAVGRVGLLY